MMPPPTTTTRARSGKLRLPLVADGSPVVMLLAPDRRSRPEPASAPAVTPIEHMRRNRTVPATAANQPR